ncbi:hypothetical protein HBH56_012880 [Parastagonospora nodorum]|uniref:Uncharacterized protein n=1 Tax=Phaeosphaeria nodorum (strain SN15 / ATCC MYA-4574 / FGSC 10173) TaxID=321614 RepID=A0A7U2EZK0_PHANO|nr:hypothetical protein HBH56_012880 [Parastagonospora nodorum]QRC94818.1 hypothetical protein JI435_406410 [Parastagonospora nodorum SN15]KAH3937107.1 hypothetical protein HBH54_021560 [Parastagonospora nodorum]KAH4134406.1 hypothetical protein HBH45_161580 [Parastagonospora nodorum]KAH4173555.1 hypothetical protein HBH44_022030 [Parastagonospora nodorum]
MLFNAEYLPGKDGLRTPKRPVLTLSETPEAVLCVSAGAHPADVLKVQEEMSEAERRPFLDEVNARLQKELADRADEIAIANEADRSPP